ncbi:MAG: DUF4190 domain-containing protein [Saccharofermentans sp.]|nr:DUF4190 domain-containing protein [Saccharofermentans sp.]
MRKINPLVLIVYTVCFVGAAYLIGYGADMLTGMKGGLFRVLAVLACWIIYLDTANLIFYPIARRILEKNLGKLNFGMTRTFETSGPWSMHSMLCIEEATGRVALASTFNPFKFQMVHASELSHVRSAYSRAPFGGTRYVFLQFYHGKRRFRFPTFTSRVSFLLSSKQVQESIAAADELADLLKRFALAEESKPAAPGSKAPLAKGGIAGFILAFIAYDINATFVFMYSIYLGPLAMQDDFFKMLSYLVFLPGIILAVVGLILASSSLAKASKTPMRGKGFAIAAIVINAVHVVALAIMLLSFQNYYFV